MEDDPSPAPEDAPTVAARRARLTRLYESLEQLGLTPSEARILAALMQAGSATAPQLSRLAGVPRTNTYPVIESLAAQQLATKLPGKGPTMWAAPERTEVIPQLEALLVATQADRLREHRLKAEAAAKTMARLLPETPAVTHPYLQILRGAGQIKRAYDQLVRGAERELLVCNRPPYTHDPRFPNLVVLDAMARGLRARALYQAAQWLDPSPATAAFRRASSDYHRAGVEGRLAEVLPVKMAVADSRVALVTLSEAADGEDAQETTMLIHHAGYCNLHALTFESLWQGARPCEDEGGLPISVESAG